MPFWDSLGVGSMMFHLVNMKDISINFFFSLRMVVVVSLLLPLYLIILKSLILV